MLAYADKKAAWWLKPEHDNDGRGDDRCKRRVEIVIEEDGRVVANHPLGTKIYGSIVRTLVQQPKGNFAIPHLRGHQYDNYQVVPELKARAQELLNQLAPEISELLRRMYALDDTAGVALAAAEAWWEQACQIEEVSKWNLLRQLQPTVGPPYYLQHSSQLLELLPQVQAGLQQVRLFLAEVPLPSPAPALNSHEQMTPGDGCRFRWRHTVSAQLNQEYYRRAVPFMLAEFTDGAYHTPLEQLAHCYGVRTFERGLNWFGLLDPEPQPAGLHLPDQLLTASPLLGQLFDVVQGPV